MRAGPQALYPFEPALASRIVSSVQEAVQPLHRMARSVAIVTAPAIRPSLARLMRAHLADLPVLSILEIPETKTIDVVAVVGNVATDEPALIDHSKDPF